MARAKKATQIENVIEQEAVLVGATQSEELVESSTAVETPQVTSEITPVVEPEVIEQETKAPEAEVPEVETPQEEATVTETPEPKEEPIPDFILDILSRNTSYRELYIDKLGGIFAPGTEVQCGILPKLYKNPFFKK